MLLHSKTKKGSNVKMSRLMIQMDLNKVISQKSHLQQQQQKSHGSYRTAITLLET